MIFHKMFYRKKRRRHSTHATSQEKKAARELLLPRLQYFAEKYNFSYNRVSFRNQRTRWGSCSSQKNLNFNIRLAQLSDELRDYVIVHELCHTRQMNHSKAFWNEVANILPHYGKLRAQMRKIRIPFGGVARVERETNERLKRGPQKRIIRIYTYF